MSKRKRAEALVNQTINIDNYSVTVIGVKIGHLWYDKKNRLILELSNGGIYPYKDSIKVVKK